VSNATLTVLNGAALGFHGERGLRLQAGAQLISEGKPNFMNRFVRFDSVQEQANTNWASAASSEWVTVGEDLTSGTKPAARFRFTDFPLIAKPSSYHYVGGAQIAS